MGRGITLRDLHVACLENCATGLGDLTSNGRGHSRFLNDKIGKDFICVLVQLLKDQISKRKKSKFWKILPEVLEFNYSILHTLRAHLHR